MSDDKEAEYNRRLKIAVSMMERPTLEQMTAMADAEEACRCKHCGRCVLAGPPCCYDAVYELYQKTYSEMLWLRKVQSKKDKTIDELKRQISELKKDHK
jgi:hypothetical protein